MDITKNKSLGAIVGCIAVFGCGAPTSQHTKNLRSASQLLLSANAMTNTLIIGHRGSPGEAPENTVASFHAAIEAKADLVEFDFHTTSDGELAVIHDSGLARTTNASEIWGDEDLAVKHRTLEEVKELDAGAWYSAEFIGETIPSIFEALFAISGNAIPLVEHKTGTPEQLAKNLMQAGLTEKVVVQSFNWNFIRELHALNDKITTALLGSGTIDEKLIKKMVKTGAKIICWSYQSLRPKHIQLAHANKLQVYTYTLDNPQKAAQLVAWGVDGVITNYPREMRQALSH